MYYPKEHYHRNLPHYQPQDGIFFITYRLFNSIPLEVLDKLKADYMSELNSANNEGQRVKTAQSRYFGLFDNLLDKANSGPTYLSEPAIAKIVVDSLHYLDSRDWTLISFCIMPNHVHLVVEKPEKELFRILQSHKRHTARESDKLLNRTGNFWQAESYDHCVRDGNELERIIKYVLNNPVKAALVKSWEDWPHSYCKPALNPM